jgi:hypothetical protein
MIEVHLPHSVLGALVLGPLLTLAVLRREQEADDESERDYEHLQPVSGCYSTEARTNREAKNSFSLSHAERAARSLYETVPKVPEGRLGGFWHFWHPVG